MDHLLNAPLSPGKPGGHRSAQITPIKRSGGRKDEHEATIQTLNSAIEGLTALNKPAGS